MFLKKNNERIYKLERKVKFLSSIVKHILNSDFQSIDDIVKNCDDVTIMDYFSSNKLARKMAFVQQQMNKQHEIDKIISVIGGTQEKFIVEQLNCENLGKCYYCGSSLTYLSSHNINQMCGPDHIECLSCGTIFPDQPNKTMELVKIIKLWNKMSYETNVDIN